MSGRVHRSVMNIKVGMVFYVLSLLLAFYSRKVFLDCLGAEFIGLTVMLMNIMSYLSIAELGIGTSIIYFLYKPLEADDHEKINEVMSMLAFLYRCIGGIILAIGIVVSIFFPLWFKNLSIGLPLVFFAFYSFLLSSVAGYIFNYKQLLVTANQKQYLVSAFFQTIGIAQSITQILLTYYYHNLWLWIIVGLLFTIIGIIVFNIRIRQLYPWLKINLGKGRLNLKLYPEVLKKTRNIFWQKIKDVLLFRSDELLIGIFVSIPTIAMYGNYTIITNKLNYLVNIFSDGLAAGVGNIVASGNKHNIMKVYWELTAFRFVILGIVIFPPLMLIQAFIGVWLGTQYQLADIIVYLLMLHFFFRLQCGNLYSFISAYGLYEDVWAAWTELIINLAITLSLAPSLGIIGILIGKIVSFSLITVFWKPYYVFSRAFKLSVWVFWRKMLPYYTIFGLITVLSLLIKDHFEALYPESCFTQLLYGTAILVLFLLLYFYLLFTFTDGMKYLVARKPWLYAIVNKVSIHL